MNKEISAVEAILDPNNNDNVVLYNSKNEAVEFEQIFIMPFEGKDFAILKPVLLMEGLNEGEALVFEIYNDNDEDKLRVVTEDRIIDAVFDKYFEMLEDSQK